VEVKHFKEVWRMRVPPKIKIFLWQLIRGRLPSFLIQNPSLDASEAAMYLMSHKYRGSQQSSREVKPKFIDLTQGEPKNIYKP
jgi:hypothetical protein